MECIPHLLSTLIFEDLLLNLQLSLNFLTRLAGQSALAIDQLSHLTPIPVLGLETSSVIPGFLVGVGIQTQVLIHIQQALYGLRHLPNLDSSFLKTANTRSSLNSCQLGSQITHPPISLFTGK